MFNIGSMEILQIVESVAKDKGISRDHLISAMEQAIQIAGRKKYGYEHNIKAEISRKTGEIKLYRVLDVVEVLTNPVTQISILDAKYKKFDAEVGDSIYELLPPINFGRIAAQSAKQVIIQKITEVEREKQYYDFKDRVGEIINGVVKRIEFGNIIVDLGRAEAIIKRDQLIRGENFKINDRIKAYVQDVKLEQKGPQIFLSRTDNKMLAKLFELEVPEIYDNIVEIKSIARDPGSKAKIAVFASDSSTDAVGSCVGVRGNRVKAITNELNGEKIDVVLWSRNVAQFVISAMAPAEISKIVIDEDRRKVDVIVPKEKLNIAIGRCGQNVRLASKLIGWSIDVMTEEQESKRRTEEFKSTTERLMNALNIEEVVAQLLAVENYTTVEQIAASDTSNLINIEGFDEKLAIELKHRANNYISINNEKIIEKLEYLGVRQELIDILDLLPDSILALAEYGVKTIEDLGEMTVDEFINLVPNSNLSKKDVELLIQSAKNQEKK